MPACDRLLGAFVAGLAAVVLAGCGGSIGIDAAIIAASPSVASPSAASPTAAATTAAAMAPALNAGDFVLTQNEEPRRPGIYRPGPGWDRGGSRTDPGEFGATMGSIGSEMSSCMGFDLGRPLDDVSGPLFQKQQPVAVTSSNAQILTSDQFAQIVPLLKTQKFGDCARRMLVSAMRAALAASPDLKSARVTDLGATPATVPAGAAGRLAFNVKLEVPGGEGTLLIDVVYLAEGDVLSTLIVEAVQASDDEALVSELLPRLASKLPVRS